MTNALEALRHIANRAGAPTMGYDHDMEREEQRATLNQIAAIARDAIRDLTAAVPCPPREFIKTGQDGFGTVEGYYRPVSPWPPEERYSKESALLWLRFLLSSGSSRFWIN